MVENLAVVTEILSDGKIVCEQGVGSICGSCTDQKDDCSPELFKPVSKNIKFTVKNSYGAKLNQVVRIGIPAKSVLMSAIIVYFVPLVGIIIGVMVSMIFTTEASEYANYIAIIGAFVGLFIGILVSYCIAKLLVNSIWSPRMVGVLQFNANCSQVNKKK